MPIPVFPFALFWYLLGVVARMLVFKIRPSLRWLGIVLAGCAIVVFPTMDIVFAMLESGEASKIWYRPATGLFLVGFFVPERLKRIIDQYTRKPPDPPE